MQAKAFYIIGQYEKKLGFKDWFWGKKPMGGGLRVGGIIDKPEIKHLMNARGCNVHKESVPKGATREISLGTVNGRTRTVSRWLINEDSYMCYYN